VPTERHRHSEIRKTERKRRKWNPILLLLHSGFVKQLYTYERVLYPTTKSHFLGYWLKTNFRLGTLSEERVRPRGREEGRQRRRRGREGKNIIREQKEEEMRRSTSEREKRR
jgi:hypothetical protein